jgi:hypothetical protein
LTGFKGYLDRLRENLVTLDEQVENARRMSKVKGKGDSRVALQYSKTLRDLVELRDKTLLNIKAHLLGRNATGVVNEPSDIYDGNPQVEFERTFKLFMAPWTAADLKIKCDDCGLESEEVTTRHIQRGYESEYFDLCNACYEKRKGPDEPGQS